METHTTSTHTLETDRHSLPLSSTYMQTHTQHTPHKQAHTHTHADTHTPLTHSLVSRGPTHLILSLSCLLRIVDSFGTEPAFNFEPYAKTHRMKTQWGMQNLNPQQFYTMFRECFKPGPGRSECGFLSLGLLLCCSERSCTGRSDSPV